MPHSLIFLIFSLTFLSISLSVLQIIRWRAMVFETDYSIGLFQEKINILNNALPREAENQFALKARIARYQSLKDAIEELNRPLEIDRVADTIVNLCFTQICKGSGCCLLYVVNKDLNLELFKSKKENSATVIKEKSGDVFDYWVLRHSSPLLIEDVANDFRFEYSFKANRRPLGSLISVPMISEHRFFGTLRLDNPKPQSFDQDDLRFLSTISEIGATALENSELFARMTHLAIHDSLTGLYSKGYFLQRLQEEFYKALRLNRPLTLLMLDIDFFKRYNDTFGHTAGDLVLSKIGSLLQNDPQELKPLCARYGGEEFCVLLYGVPKAEGFKIASSLRQRIEDEEFVLRQQQTSVTVSVGLAALEDASDSRELLAKADSAMYQAKSKGRNQVCQA